MRCPTNGYRLAAGTDLFDFIGAAYAALNPVRDEVDTRALTRDAVMIHDFHTVVGPPHHEEPVPTWEDDVTLWRTAWWEWTASKDPTVRERDTHAFGAIFARDPQTRRHLVLLNGHIDEMFDEWERLPEVERFPYDGSAALRAVGGETDQRLAAWERALPEGVSFDERTVRWSLSTPRGISDSVAPQPADDIRGIIENELASIPAEGRSLALAYVLITMSHPIDTLMTFTYPPDREEIMAEFRETHEVSVLAEQIEPHLLPVDTTTLLGSTSRPSADAHRGRRLRSAAASIAEIVAPQVNRILVGDDFDDEAD